MYIIMVDIDQWNSRMKGSLLDFAILYFAGNYPDRSLFPDVIKDLLADVWGKTDVKMPTVYSTLDRLEKQGFIVSLPEIDGRRLKKNIKVTDLGLEAKERMRKELNLALKVFKFDDDFTKGV